MIRMIRANMAVLIIECIIIIIITLIAITITVIRESYTQINCIDYVGNKKKAIKLKQY